MNEKRFLRIGIGLFILVVLMILLVVGTLIWLLVFDSRFRGVVPGLFGSD